MPGVQADLRLLLSLRSHKQSGPFEAPSYQFNDGLFCVCRLYLCGLYLYSFGWRVYLYC